MVLPLSAAQQKWMRVDGDTENAFKKSVGKEIDDKLLYGASAEDAVTYLQYVCASNKKRGTKLKHEFRRVTGRHGKIRRWTAQSIPKTILEKKGIYVIYWKSKWANAIHAALIKRIKKASCVGEELEIYNKVMSKKDHAISICND